MTLKRLAAFAVVVAATATACGLPAHDVTRLDPDSVPFGLLHTPAPAASARPAGPQTYVYFVAHDRLATVPRRVVGENVPAEAARALIDGPSSAEAAAGLSSDVPSQTRLVSLDLAGSVAIVDLSSEFGSVGGSDQVLAVAQFVYTLTASKYIDAVRFAIGGKPIEVPDESGSLSSAPRNRSDYKALAPRGS